MLNQTNGLKNALADRYRIEGELLSLPLALPAFDVVRSSPRFAAVLRRFNLDVERLTSPDGGRSR